MTLDYIDLHCDTAYELYHRNEHIESNTCAVSLDGAAPYPHYAQFFAIWSDNEKTEDEAYEHLFIKIDKWSKEV